MTSCFGNPRSQHRRPGPLADVTVVSTFWTDRSLGTSDPLLWDRRICGEFLRSRFRCVPGTPLGRLTFRGGRSSGNRRGLPAVDCQRHRSAPMRRAGRESNCRCLRGCEQFGTRVRGVSAGNVHLPLCSLLQGHAACLPRCVTGGSLIAWRHAGKVRLSAGQTEVTRKASVHRGTGEVGGTWIET